MKFSRRDFVKITGTGAIMAGMPALGAGVVASIPPVVKAESFRLAIAGYTFARLTLDQALNAMKRVGVGSSISPCSSKPSGTLNTRVR